MALYLRKIFRAGLICAAVTSLFLCVSCAKGDMLLFATAEDCETAPVSSWTAENPHAVVLQKSNAAKQKAAKQALEKNGIQDVTFLDFTAVKEKNRSAATLEKK